MGIPGLGDPTMQSKDASGGSRRGRPRRLSTHVLRPLAAAVLVAVIAVSGGVTIAQREAEIHSIDARAGAIRDLSGSALKRSGGLAVVQSGASARHVKVRIVSSDKPL